DPGVSMNGPDEDRVRLPGKVDVILEVPAASHQPDVLEPLDALSDPELPHEPSLLVSVLPCEHVSAVGGLGSPGAGVSAPSRTASWATGTPALNRSTSRSGSYSTPIGLSSNAGVFSQSCPSLAVAKLSIWSSTRFPSGSREYIEVVGPWLTQRLPRLVR